MPPGSLKWLAGFQACEAQRLLPARVRMSRKLASGAELRLECGHCPGVHLLHARCPFSPMHCVRAAECASPVPMTDVGLCVTRCPVQQRTLFWPIRELPEPLRPQPQPKGEPLCSLPSP